MTLKATMDGPPLDGGWEAWDIADPFEACNGTIFRSKAFVPTEDELVRIGFRVAPRNCSFHGGCHGGLIAALVDIAMGRNALAPAGIVGAPTASMTVDFVRAAAPGEWLESRVRIVRQTGRLAFCDASLLGPTGIVARGSGLFAIRRLAAKRDAA